MTVNRALLLDKVPEATYCLHALLVEKFWVIFSFAKTANAAADVQLRLQLK